MNSRNSEEERIVARGLKSPGPLLIVKKRLKTLAVRRIRIIVSSRETAEDVMNYFETRGAAVELDRAGEDYHVVVDLAKFKGTE
ncbi:MAG: sulfurtransferase TusA family protein [Candidatus Krumholzibacteria bacterium]|nr:sulfurtransferase TusA family protein [Candidatus Krumholzibacteria bacterium]